jgi:hypothetical protein
MINEIKLTDNNISPNQRRLRLMELGGIQITDKQKKRLKPRTSCINEVVSMVEIPKNRMGIVPKEPIQEPDEEIDIDEILKEMGYGEEEEEEEEEEEDDNILTMNKTELKKMIQDIVYNIIDEEDDLDLNEVIDTLTRKELYNK